MLKQNINPIILYAKSLVEVRNDEGEWNRRGRTLNVILLAFVAISLLSMLTNWGNQPGRSLETDEAQLTFIIIALSAVSNITLYYVNTYHSVKHAASAFLMILIALLFFADDPTQTVWGRNMIPLAIPIVMAGLILNPNFSFLVAAIVSVVSSILAIMTDQSPNAFGIISYFALALISWLTTRNLENAVIDLNVVNKELDERVNQRTKELSYTNDLLEQERLLLEERVSQRTAEISDMNTHLIQMSRIKDEFLASMSHELRTPLNAIIGYSEGIMEEAEMFNTIDEIVVDDVSKIHTSGRHLLQIINDILDISKLEANQTTIHLAPINIEAFINKLLITIEPAVLKQNNELVIENGCSGVHFVSDEFKLTQIMLNLLSNAAKFTFDGTITLKVEEVEDDCLNFSIIDTGVGIPEHAQQQIFLPFRQAENGQSRSFDGSGLGLAISSKLATILSGSISVSSAVGEGTTFSLVMPKQILPIKRPITKEDVILI